MNAHVSHVGKTDKPEDGKDDKDGPLQADMAFTSVADVFKQLERAAKAMPGQGRFDGLVFGNMSPANFDVLSNERDRRERHLRLFFLPDQEIAIVTVPSAPHEQAHSRLYTLVDRQLFAMGLDPEWRGTQATRFSLPGGGGHGEGDSGGGLRRGNRYNNQRWPALVIEAGVSQSMAALRAKGRWWLSASNFHMKVVVLVKTVIRRSLITIEKWTAEQHFGPESYRLGATTTRAATRAAAAPREPTRQQQMEISWSGPGHILDTQPNDRAAALFTVVGAPLVLRFEELFRRPPVASDGERDIEISEHDLKDLASRVWEDVE
ncbi:hypothetical protein SPBR_08591 [Sporothrix brasiliensis 5110]|uniref:Dead deah box DNA helicase n=1 Tax=Sporothrix brasiliensis 5110 TaxID=1398154 RepID=A0A0C2ELA1_9PEZI|nr:uncharacterized protein SPBR_08591 [Sporothrix brasiliensis 5110]KIH86869.1 hypothetical protein SPBR_08591 [Sporothrix brasiliensis 5110]